MLGGVPTKKPPKSASMKAMKKSAKKVYGANERIRRMRQPREDVIQAAFRVVNELTKNK